MRYINNLWIAALFISNISIAQPSSLNNGCMPNIGFELGSFDNWSCFAGKILRDGTLDLASTSPVVDRHSIIQNFSNQELDLFGGFPVNCPNGSGYSVRLGNARGGGEAERINYIINIPANQNDYSILYNYAVVFQNPTHQPWEQPRFTSKIFNISDNKYIDCGAFEFVASSNLPGFKISGVGNNVFYKEWSPVTINLTGLAGKTVRLEFSTNDCAFTQHFGYAYIDVNEDCLSAPISGSTYCGGAESVNLTAPFGFASYSWFTSDFSKLLGSENILNISPVPPANTTYALVILPYDGLGCQDTLYSTIQVSPQPFKLNVISEITGCPTGVDITVASITAGSTPGLTYAYYTNLSQTNYVPIPSKITTSGIYYIKGVNSAGCNDIKPLRVTVLEPPDLNITNPSGVCMPQKINITVPAITEGSETGLALSYWKNLATTIPLPNATAIDLSGTYYIKGVKNGGCAAVKAVEVKIGEIPNIVIKNPTACGKVDLTATSIISENTQDISYSYWNDAAATISVPEASAVTSTGTYYINASVSSGCTILYPVIVTVNPFPDFVVTDPAAVIYPLMTVDLTSAVKQNTGLSFTYWLDSLTRKPVSNPKAVDKRGKYYIRGANEFGCMIIKPVNAVIIPPPEPIVYVPTAFTPNNDGLNDVFRIKIIGETTIAHLKIYNRWGQVVYDDPNLNRYWDGKLKSLELPVGVYVWILSGFDSYFKKPFAQKGLITLLR